MQMLGEAALPTDMGWEEVRLLTDSSGPLPDVEEGAAGRPVPWVASRSGRATASVTEVAEDMARFVHFARDVSERGSGQGNGVRGIGHHRRDCFTDYSNYIHYL